MKERPRDNQGEILTRPEITVQRESGIELWAGFAHSGRLPEDLRKLDDDEALFWFAATFGHPEREAAIMRAVKEHKEHIQDAGKIQQRVHRLLSAEKAGTPDRDRDTAGELDAGVLSGRLEKIIGYFRPKKSTSPIRKVTAVTSDNIVGESSGRAIILDDEIMIFSHSKNPDNFDHEFMHGIINPIVDKLGTVLNDKQKGEIVRLASVKYKEAGGYGRDHYSLLAEELIRTYNNYVKSGKNARFDFGDNRLRKIIYGLYKQYEMVTDKKDICFEDFIIENLPRAINDQIA